MTLPRLRAPIWLHVCVAVTWVVTLSALHGLSAWQTPAGGHAPDVQLAFWQFLILVGELLWKGLEVAGKITIEVLHWMVINLSLVVTKLGNGLKTAGSAILAGFHKSWDFLKLTYDNVLKPAWSKFWRWFDKMRKWLDTTFGPTLRWLRRLRDNLLKFYKTFVQPWLTLIDVTRRLMRVLASLGLAWAHALDVKLGALEDKIERPFRYVLAKLNEVINLVNTVITAGGLFQRVALIRSIARDYRYAWGAITAPWSKGHAVPSDDDAKQAWKGRTRALVASDIRASLESGGGTFAAVVDEQAAQWRIYLRS